MKNLWLRIPEKIREEIRSVAITFVSVVVLTFGVQWLQNDVSFGLDVIAGIALAAVRAGVKASVTLIVSFFSKQ